MPANTKGKTFAPGERVIIYVGPGNSPMGWWWGLLGEDREAVITGPVSRLVDQYGAPPEYGTQAKAPVVNYDVYPADTAGLVRMILWAEYTAEGKIRELTTQRDELRYVLTQIGRAKT